MGWAPLVSWLGRNVLWIVAVSILAVGWGGQAIATRMAEGQLEKANAAAAQAIKERDEARARAKELADALATSEQRRKDDQASADKAQKEADDATKRARETAAAAGAAGDAHARAVERLRGALAAATGGAGGGGAAGAACPPRSCEAADAAAGVFATLLERCGSFVRVVAGFGDDSHDAAVAGWEALTPPETTKPAEAGPVTAP